MNWTIISNLVDLSQFVYIQWIFAKMSDISTQIEVIINKVTVNVA